MRERPGFDEIEAPAPAPRAEGLSDEEWARRRLRREWVARAIFGLVFGLAVGLVSIWHWGFLGVRYGGAGALVLAGCMVLFAALFVRRRDDRALDYAGWIALPEWKVVDSLPWWAMAAIFISLFAVVFLVGTVLVLGRLPFWG